MWATERCYVLGILGCFKGDREIAADLLDLDGNLFADTAENKVS